jgi:hypothetical protein
MRRPRLKLPELTIFTAVLYGKNHFVINIDGTPHYPVSLQSPEVFGPLGLPDRLSLLRDLRKISITLDPKVHDTQYWVNRRHRGRLGLFVKILKESAEDENQKSLLKVLKVHLERPCRPTQDDLPVFAHSAPLVPQSVPLLTPEERWLLNEEAEKNQFALEALAPLRGIKEVHITGVDKWFAQCLQLCIQGKGGDVKDIKYPYRKLKRRKEGTRKTKEYVRNTKKWYMPGLDWKEFAERNGIKLPADIERFWAER